MDFIVNADDFGLDEETSAAIVKAFVENRINRTSAMVNMSYFEKSYSESINNNFSSAVGLHLNLTKGMPLTNKIKKYELFCDRDGYFNKRILQDTYYRVLPLSKDVKNAVYEEIDAQCSKYLDYYAGIGTYHMDSHHHIHKNINILPLCLDIAKKHGFKSIRFAKTSGSIVNSSYNRIINGYIRNSMKIPYCTFFYSVSDYKTRSNQVGTLDSFEIECHPKDIAGVLFDGEIQLPLLGFYTKIGV